MLPMISIFIAPTINLQTGDAPPVFVVDEVVALECNFSWTFTGTDPDHWTIQESDDYGATWYDVGTALATARAAGGIFAASIESWFRVVGRDASETPITTSNTVVLPGHAVLSYGEDGTGTVTWIWTKANPPGWTFEGSDFEDFSDGGRQLDPSTTNMPGATRTATDNRADASWYRVRVVGGPDDGTVSNAIQIDDV